MAIPNPFDDISHALNHTEISNISSPFIIPFAGCVLPISGQYGILPRVLFYLLLIFSLLARSQEWLAVGALATSLTFSGSAAIHIIAATFISPASAGDDVIAIAAILSAALLIAVPLFNWSSTLRRLEARSLIVYWAVLIVFGWVCVSVSLHERSQSLNAQPVELPPTFIIRCQLDPGSSHTLSQLLDAQLLATFQCTYPCNSVAVNVPFRSSDSAVARTFQRLLPWFYPGTHRFKLFIDTWCLPLFALQVSYTCFAGRSSPSQVRHRVYLVVCKLKGGNYHNTEIIARVFAAILYLCITTIALLCLLSFALNISEREFLLRSLPENEAPDMVGQWSPWVGVGLAITGAVIARFHNSFKRTLFGYFKKSVSKVMGIIQDNETDHGCSTHLSKPSNSVTSPSIIHLPQRIPSTGTTITKLVSTVRRIRSSIGKQFIIIISCLSNCLRGTQTYSVIPFLESKRYAVNEWRDFSAWLKNPHYLTETFPHGQQEIDTV